MNVDAEKIINDTLSSERFKNSLADELAVAVRKEYHFTDIEGELIKREVRQMVKQQASEMIYEVVNEYYEMSPIKKQLESILKSLTREQVIDILKGILK